MRLSLIICIAVNILLQIGAAHKWALPPMKSVLVITASTIFAFFLGLLSSPSRLSLLTQVFIIFLSQNVVFVGIILLFFYRDPERRPPQDPLAIVSPADGNIIYIEEREAGGLLASEKKGEKIILEEMGNDPLAQEVLWQIGISMVYTDVHINRAPLSGRVTFLKYRPGKFLSLRHADAANVNERQTMVIENQGMRVAIVQIASRMVRRIEAYVKKDAQIEKGQKIGRIIFGSQVDIFIPANFIGDIKVHENDHVLAGETILCRMKEIGKFKLPE